MNYNSINENKYFIGNLGTYFLIIVFAYAICKFLKFEANF